MQPAALRITMPIGILRLPPVIVGAKEREWKLRIRVDNPHFFSYFGLACVRKRIKEGKEEKN
jgi:hypothetical protein